MDNNDFNREDVLGRLIRQMPLESPSDDFVAHVMAGINSSPETVPEKKPFLFYLKSAMPWIILSLVFAVVFCTSDLPFLQWLPGKSLYTNNLLPLFGTMIESFREAFNSRFISFGLMILISGSLLVLVDRLFSRRFSS